jgi:hypothetical protein
MSMALLLEVFYYNCDYDKISFLINSKDFELFCPKEFPIPITLKRKIVSEAYATKFRRKLFTLLIVVLISFSVAPRSSMRSLA